MRGRSAITIIDSECFGTYRAGVGVIVGAVLHELQPVEVVTQGLQHESVTTQGSVTTTVCCRS